MEVIYARLSRSGALALTLGIISAILGVTAGVLGIINGARLLAARKDLFYNT